MPVPVPLPRTHCLLHPSRAESERHAASVLCPATAAAATRTACAVSTDRQLQLTAATKRAFPDHGLLSSSIHSRHIGDAHGTRGGVEQPIEGGPCPSWLMQIAELYMSAMLCLEEEGEERPASQQPF